LVLAGAMTAGWARARAEPQLTEASPKYGDVLDSLPQFLHLCFSEPAKVDDSKDWKFDVLTPDRQALGLRIVFEPSGNCVDVYPGAPEDPPNGIWTFNWLVRAQSDDSEGSGVIKFQVGELRSGERPLVREEGKPGEIDDSGGSSTVLLVALGAGIALVLAAGGAFVFLRRRG
jgi:hypothetical protein